jgi:hypothetical protein
MIKIAIATNKNFYEKTLPILINSLLLNGIDKNDIFVFNAGFDENIIENIDGITYHYLSHNSYEYSPLIEICEKEIKSEYWFLIHDTCKVGPEFKSKLYSIPVDKPSKIALKTFPAMSIGLYSYEYLLSIKSKLYEIKNTDYSYESMKKWKLWGVPNEDYILWQTEPQPFLYGTTEWNVVDYDNWYNTGLVRRTEYYPSLDLYKNKSNWGQNGQNMTMSI